MNEINDEHLLQHLPPPPPCIAAAVLRHSGKTRQELHDGLEACAKITMEQMLEAAAIIYVAAQQGYDLRPILVGFMKYAAMVAFGQLSPEAVVEFSDRRSILNTLSRLPIHEQHNIMKKGSVTVGFMASGGPDQRRVELKDLTPDLCRQVFSRDRILTPEEQVVRIRNGGTQQAPLPSFPPSIKINRKKHQVEFTEPIILGAKQIGSILAAIAAG